MSFGQTGKVLLLSVLFVFCLAQIGCTSKKQSAGGGPGGPAAQKPEVVVDNVKQDDVQLYIYVEAKTEPYKSVDIKARVAGYLEQLFFRQGAIVKEGDRLALIEQDQYKVALDAAKAELDVSMSREALAKANLDRARELVKTKTMTEEEFQSRMAEHQMALANVELCKTSVRRASLDLEYTDMRSPIPGKTTKHLVDVGNFISPTGNQSVLLSVAQLDPIYIDFKLSDRQLADLKERMGFREEFDAAMKGTGEVKTIETTSLVTENGKQGQATRILPPLNGNFDSVEKGRFDLSLTTGINVLSADFSLSGRIVALVDNKFEVETGQITLRGEIRNPLFNINGNEDYMIYPGQICRVRIPHEKVKDAILIHEEAILTDLDTKYVLLVEDRKVEQKDEKGLPMKNSDGSPIYEFEKDDKGEKKLDASGNPIVKIDHVVQRRDIKLGRLLDSQQRIVLSGLEKGESYIVKGVQRARIGAPVVPKTLEDFLKERSLEGKPKDETPTTGPSEISDAATDVVPVKAVEVIPGPATDTVKEPENKATSENRTE